MAVYGLGFDKIKAKSKKVKNEHIEPVNRITNNEAKQ